MGDMRNVALPEELCSTAEKRFAHRFGSLEELLTATLQQLVRDDALRMDENEQQIIEARLKGLGYI